MAAPDAFTLLDASDIQDLTAAVRALTAALREGEAAYQRQLQRLAAPDLLEELRGLRADLNLVLAVLVAKTTNGSTEHERTEP